jgi:hypothetical protein
LRIYKPNWTGEKRRANSKGGEMRTIEIKFTVDDIEYTADVELDIWNENYGEDADGNRGVWTTFAEINSITVFKDGKEVKETPEMARALHKAIDEADIPENEPDFDDIGD